MREFLTVCLLCGTSPAVDLLRNEITKLEVRLAVTVLP